VVLDFTPNAVGDVVRAADEDPRPPAIREAIKSAGAKRRIRRAG
jgi:hypothetical protein